MLNVRQWGISEEAVIVKQMPRSPYGQRELPVGDSPVRLSPAESGAGLSAHRAAIRPGSSGTDCFRKPPPTVRSLGALTLCMDAGLPADVSEPSPEHHD